MTASTALYGPLWQLGGWQGNWTDASDVEWWVSSEDGWSSSPNVRADFGDLPGADGGTDSVPLYSPRVITLSGTAIAVDAAGAAAARLAFSSLLEAQRSGTLSCTDGGATLSAAVRLSGPVRITQVGANAFDYQIQLTAPDPRKYAPVVEATTGLPLSASGLTFPLVFPLDFGSSSGGSVAVLNSGTVKTWPVIRITGPVVNPRVVNAVTGDELRVAITLLPGQYLDIDTASRTALLMGSASRRSAVTVTGEWLPIAPGAGSVQFGADLYDPAALMTVAVRSAYL